MTQNKGTLLVSPIRPINGDLNIPVAYAEEVRGGWHSVDTTSDRDLIGEGRRRFGMIVYITNDDAFFQLKQFNSPSLADNLNWVQVNLIQSDGEWISSVLAKQGTPPPSPNDGDRYLIEVGTGIWTAYSDYIAEYTNSNWVYTLPTEGTTVRVDNEPGPIYSYLGGAWTKQDFVGDAQYPYYVVPVSTNLNIGTGSEYLIYGDLTLNGNINNNGKVVVLNGSISGGGTISGSGIIEQVNLLTDLISGFGITISSTSSTTRTISTNIIAGTGIYLSQNGNQLDISSLPQLVSPSYVIQANEKVDVPAWKEYFIYGDLTVNGYLDIDNDGKVVVVNGNLIVATGATVTNLGNVELYQLITAADDNLKIDITEIRYGTSGRILYESELKWIPLYGTYARVLTEDSNFVYTTSSAYLTSTASTFENYMGIGTSDPLKKLHIHNSGLLIDGNVGEQESGLGDPNSARLTIDSESSELHSLIDARNDYGAVIHIKGNIEGGNRFPSVSIGTDLTNGLFQVNDYYGLNSFYINRSGNVGLHTLSPSFSTHIVGDLRIDLGSDANYDLLIRGTSSKLERIPHGSPNQVLTIPIDGATPSWSNPIGGSVSITIDPNEISFGNGTGLTSSTNLKFFDTCNSSILGGQNNYSFLSCRSSIIGGQDNGLTSSCNSLVLGGFNNCMISNNHSSILGGYGNILTSNSSSSSILGGIYNTINNSRHSTILGGIYNNVLYGSCNSSILGGIYNTIIYTSCYSTILGGNDNIITNNSRKSSILAGNNNTITNGTYNSSILGGYNSIINYGSHNSSILGGNYNNITNGSCNSSILGGDNNIITNSSFRSSILGGNDNTITYTSFNSTILGGNDNTITNGSYESTILGGENNIITNSSYRSSILGGNDNTITYTSFNSTILGGNDNTITNNSFKSSILGGDNNIITNCSFNSTILGGDNNIITNGSYESSILGGNDNTITNNSFKSSILGGNNNNIISSTSSSIQTSNNIYLLDSINTSVLAINGGSGLTFSNRINNTIVQDFTIAGSMSTIISPNEYFGITGTFSSPTQIVVVNGIVINIT